MNTAPSILAMLLLVLTSPLLRADDTAAIQKEIDDAFKSGLHRVVIAPGVYHLSAPANSGTALRFSKMKDFEIDATGVTLIFTMRNKGSILFGNCDGVSFHGATLLRDPLPFSQGKIIAVTPDDKTVDVKVDAGYPADVENAAAFPSVFLDLYKNRRWQADNFTPKGMKLEKLGPDSFRFHAGNPATAAAGWTVGASVAWRGTGGPDIANYGCANMKITDVTIKSGAGFCVMESGGEGHNYYSYTVTYGPTPPGATEEPLLASNADAFHSYAVRHGPTLENCHFEGMNDDGVPIHGQYALLQEATGADIIVQPRTMPFCQAGDSLRFNDERGACVAEAKVVSQQTISYKPTQPVPKDLRLFQEVTRLFFNKITLDHPVAAKFGWLVANANANGDGFVVRGCTIRNSRARGMLIKASDGLIENCTVEGASMGGIVISPEMSYWNESDFSRNIIVRHNTLRAANYWTQSGSSQAGTLTVGAWEYRHFVPLPGGHRNITIEDNTFENDDGTNIMISSAQGVTIRNNRFLHPMQNPSTRGQALGVDPEALIWLTECSGVDLSGNVVVDPGPNFKTAIKATKTATGTGFTDGVTQQK